MPTGYTAQLAKGEQSFPNFAMECARAFGALILMRDDPMHTPIPEAFEPSLSYHQESKAKAEARLNDLRAMTTEDIFAAHQAARAEVLGARARDAMERSDKRKRYEEMLAQVNAWEPPTDDHQGLKKFMTEQLAETIRFDCGEVRWPEMPNVDPADWFDAEVAKAERDIAYADKHMAEEVERATERTGWVQALRASLDETADA